jgi:DNA-binding transcriptional ArsR family regulator
MGEEAREIMEALGDKTRFAMLDELAKKPMTGEEIAEHVGKARSTVESHLSMLLRLQLVSRKLDDRTYYYEATDLAKSWLEKMGTPKPYATAPPPEVLKPMMPIKMANHPGVRYAWIYLPIIIGAIYVILNVYVVPIQVIMPSLILGTIAAFLGSRMTEVLKSIVLMSFTIAFLSYTLVFASSIFSMVLLFVVALIFCLMGGVVSWYLMKKMRKMLKI